MKRFMGLDVGEKTIGVAVSDLLGITAQGVKTIKRKELESDLRELKSLVDQYEVDTIIVGLPRNMNGSYGGSAQRAKEFGEILEKELNYKIVYWDERLSTVSAEKALLEADVSRKKRRGVIDKLAAVIILQNYLDYNHKV
ncbi:MAG: putative holliday junction resolvase [Clostridiales bacterium]|jgi:putative Holliday junction resolvase|nr:putative holliday junction resolvase [Clostridiales bacterium]